MTIFMGTGIEIACAENPNLEMTFSGEASLIRLSPQGHYEGSAEFISPVLDAGYITTLSGINWDVEEYGNSSTTVQVRIHEYKAPTGSWSNGELPDSNDPYWGENDNHWETVDLGGSPLNGDLFRYIQYRVLFQAGGI